MPEYAQTLTYFFAVGSVLLNCLVAIAVVTRIATGVWLPASVRDAAERWALPVATLFALGGVGASVWYEVVGVPVCVLCWFARCMLLPLALILVVAVWRRSTDVRPYALALAGVGLVISGYHHLLQIGLVTGSLCSALDEGGVDCARRYVYEFDWVTMPWFGFTLFSTIALLVWIARRPTDTH